MPASDINSCFPVRRSPLPIGSEAVRWCLGVSGILASRVATPRFCLAFDTSRRVQSVPAQRARLSFRARLLSTTLAEPWRCRYPAKRLCPSSRGFLACPALDHSSASTREARRALFPAGARLYPDDKRPRHYPVAVSLPRETRFPLSAIALSLHKPNPARDEDRGVPGAIAATFLASPRRSPSLVYLYEVYQWCQGRRN